MNPIRKVMSNNQKENIRTLHRVEDPSDDERKYDRNMETLKRRSSHRRKQTTNTSDIVMGKRKMETDKSSETIFSKPRATTRQRFNQQRKSTMEKRTLNTEDKGFVEFRGNSYKSPLVIQQSEEKEKNVLDSRNGSSRTKMRIVPERNIYGQETKETLTKHLHNDASNAVVNSSFDQMSFWRNRFESERIKSFLEKKESTAKLKNAKAETPTSKKSKSRQREPVSGNKKIEPNFVTKAPQFKIKERHETNRKVTPKQDSPRIMKPVMTNEYNNRKIKPFIHRTSMTENNSRHRLSEVTQAQERTVEALPFVSQQERHSEEDQVN